MKREELKLVRERLIKSVFYKYRLSNQTNPKKVHLIWCGNNHAMAEAFADDWLSEHKTGRLVLETQQKPGLWAWDSEFQRVIIPAIVPPKFALTEIGTGKFIMKI